MLPWVGPSDEFPRIETAPVRYDGLICAGADLSPERLLDAYRRGIFPWFSPGDPILWWSPDPRMVLYPDEFIVSRSLRQRLRRGNFEVRFDHDFPAVIESCATAPRKGQNGTWITREMRDAYIGLFRRGFAHSVETYSGGVLAGGLYGIAIGKMFYGESMFSRIDNASKIAMAHLVCFLASRAFGLIDCQMKTSHLASLGAREIPRAVFIKTLQKLTTLLPLNENWPQNAGEMFRKEW
ncbi:MAG: leucyl/phenylalanyl-tRNA--protein transferase [Candidatus Accumulibacter sp.]|jgi:leucyl/phenylalanyl-tRNA--protein transferase|nr:leucyl/phenylalanyl-tRNA--protein transferase [Accumulibacter sp.]